MTDTLGRSLTNSNDYYYKPRYHRNDADIRWVRDQLMIFHDEIVNAFKFLLREEFLKE